MCKTEFDGVDETTPLSWKSKFKWFTDDLNFLNRVADGSFGNSRFKPNRYEYMVLYCVESLDVFDRVSKHELMLARRKQPMSTIKLLKKVGKIC